MINASRDFVCIRPATYEDKKEAAFLKSLYLGRSGELENTVFCILTPDGKKQLTRTHRSPHFVFRSATQMATMMEQMAILYPQSEESQKADPTIPEMKSIRLGLNVSSCDGLPTVLVYGKNEKQVAEIKQHLASVAWNKNCIGKFIFASSTRADDFSKISGLKDLKPGILIVKPDAYGMEGELIDFIAADASKETVDKKLLAAANDYERIRKSHDTHVRNGARNGKKWETEIPITDPGTIGAMERMERRGSGGSRRRK